MKDSPRGKHEMTVEENIQSERRKDFIKHLQIKDISGEKAIKKLEAAEKAQKLKEEIGNTFHDANISPR